MIHHELLRDKGILIVTPEGPLQQADFENLSKVIDSFIESEGELHGFMIQAESFPGWSDFEALVSHLKFVKNHHQHVAKVAAVTDSGFLAILPSIVSHFVHAQVRHFDFEDKQAAMAWLESRE